MKFVVATFPDLKTAIRSTEVLRKVQAEGWTKVYAAEMISRSATGELSRIEVIKRGRPATTSAAFIGGLAALPFDSLAMLIGATAGALIGYSAELLNEGDAAKIKIRTSDTLDRGKVAVIAEVTEDGSIELAARMERLGGSVLRE